MNQISKILYLGLLVVLSTFTAALSQNSPNGVKGKGDAASVFTQFQGLPTFRAIPWGATKEFVLRNDKSKPKETGEDYLVLRDQLGELSVDITYFFWRGHFVKGAYQTTNDLKNYSSYIEKYENLKRLITQKYSTPMLDLTNWIDFSYRNNQSMWLRALSIGHLEHFAYWKNDQLIISIKLSGINEKPVIKVEYYIQNFDNKMEETNDREILDDL